MTHIEAMMQGYMIIQVIPMKLLIWNGHFSNFRQEIEYFLEVLHAMVKGMIY